MGGSARIQERLFIDGKFVDAADGTTFEVVNPYDGSKLADVAEAIEYVKNWMRPQAASRAAAIRIRFDSIPDITRAVSILRIEGAGLEASAPRYDGSQQRSQMG